VERYIANDDLAAANRRGHSSSGIGCHMLILKETDIIIFTLYRPTYMTVV